MRKHYKSNKRWKQKRPLDVVVYGHRPKRMYERLMRKQRLILSRLKRKQKPAQKLIFLLPIRLLSTLKPIDETDNCLP